MEIALEILIALYILVIGAYFGSFFNVLALRLPKNETIMGRSYCPTCQHQLSFLETIPVLSYLIQGGKCKHCKAKIEKRYLIVEVLTATLFYVSYIFLFNNMIEYIVVISFISLLIITTLSDLTYRIVDDKILIVFFPIILVLRLLGDFIPWYYSLLGGGIVLLFLGGIALYGQKKYQQTALGGGDIKLYVIIGVFLGLELVFLSLMFASVLALIYSFMRRRKGEIPFVPFIAIGSLLAYVVGPSFIDWYISLIF